MKSTLLKDTLLAAILALVAACGADPKESSRPSNEVTYYEGVGQYLFHSTEDSLTTVTINHEEIPGFMNAMAMPFAIEDASLVDGLEPGQGVKFRVVVLKDGYYFVDRVEPLQTQNEH